MFLVDLAGEVCGALSAAYHLGHACWPYGRAAGLAIQAAALAALFLRTTCRAFVNVWLLLASLQLSIVGWLGLILCWKMS